MKLEIRNVSKSFKDVKALDNVSLNFETGTIYGLLGRNGAGKSTLMNIITGRLVADSGTVTLDGEPVSEHDEQLSRIFMVGEENFYPDDMKVKHALLWTSRYYPSFDRSKADALAERFELDQDKKISKLSTGYRSLFKNIVALSVDVPFILLDEPVLGLDANHRDLFYKLLVRTYAESETPKAVVVSTHLIEEAEHLVENVAIIKEGRMLLQEPVEDLLACSCSVSGPAASVDAVARKFDPIGGDQVGNIRVAYFAQKLDPAELPEDVSLGPVDLQRLFIELTNGVSDRTTHKGARL
ncbi:MAG: ABC transporter ATP-binding protein [Sphaerochaetaceae bacterium]|jgi:ABC-2 type transport system ATP-binding protein